VKPAVPQGVARRLRVVPVALHHQIAPDHNLASGVRSKDVIVLVHDTDLDAVGLTPDRREPLSAGFVGHDVFPLGQPSAGKRGFALRKHADKDRSKTVKRFLQAFYVHRSGAVHHGTQARQVACHRPGRVQQALDHGGNEHALRDAVSLDQCVEILGAKTSKRGEDMSSGSSDLVKDHQAGSMAHRSKYGETIVP